MKKLVVVILFALLALMTIGIVRLTQKFKPEVWDTTKQVLLPTSKPNNSIVECNLKSFGEAPDVNVCIYVDVEDIRRKILEDSISGDDKNALLLSIDNEFKVGNEVTRELLVNNTGRFLNAYMGIYIIELIEEGKAAVYDNKKNSFVPYVTIHSFGHRGGGIGLDLGMESNKTISLPSGEHIYTFRIMS